MMIRTTTVILTTLLAMGVVSCKASKKPRKKQRPVQLDPKAAEELAMKVIRALKKNSLSDFQKLAPSKEELAKIASALGKPAPDHERTQRRLRSAFRFLKTNEYLNKLVIEKVRFVRVQTRHCRRARDIAMSCDLRLRVTDGNVRFDLVMSRSLITRSGIYLGSKPSIVGIN
jgi:hypothetical protein